MRPFDGSRRGFYDLPRMPGRTHFTVAALGLAAAILLGLIGCQRHPAGQAPGPVAARGSRLVSLSPALTQIISDLGQAHRIVAVGAYDPVAPRGAAVVGDLYQIDYERLISLSPTDIFLQATRAPLPGRLIDLAADHHWSLHRWTLETRADVIRTVYDRAAPPDANPSVSGALGIPEAGRRLVERMQTILRRVGEVTRREPAPPVLLVVGKSPMTAAGPRTFMGEMLRIAGGSNVVRDTEHRYPVIDREQLLRLAPSVIVLIRPEPGTAAATDTQATPDALALPPSMRSRVVQLTDPAALLPSSAMPRIVVALAKGIHPALAHDIDAAAVKPE